MLFQKEKACKTQGKKQKEHSLIRATEPCWQGKRGIMSVLSSERCPVFRLKLLVPVNQGLTPEVVSYLAIGYPGQQWSLYSTKGQTPEEVTAKVLSISRLAVFLIACVLGALAVEVLTLDRLPSQAVS
jgi:hypothetical protein